MRYTILCLLFIVSFFGFSQNQKKIDSFYQEIENAKEFNEKSKIESKLVTYLSNLGKIDSAKIVVDSAIKNAFKSQDPQAIALAHIKLGNIYFSTWQSSEALKSYRIADSILTSNNIKNKTLLAAIGNSGIILQRLITDKNDSLGYQRAAIYYKRALDVARELNDSSQIGYFNIRIGHTYNSRQNYDKALEYFYVAEKYIPEKSGQTTNLYYALGNVLTKKGDHKSGLVYMDKYLEKRKQTGNPTQLAVGYWSYGNYFFQIKNYKKAIEYEKKSAELFLKYQAKDFGRLTSIYRTIYQSYKELGDYKLAFEYYEKSNIMKDSAEVISKRATVEELEAKYQTEKKEQEITLLKSQQELTEQKQKSERNLFIAGIGLTSLAGLFLFFLFKNRQSTNKKLKQLDKAKSNFFANISHEFRTPLTLITNPIDNALENESLPQKEKEQFKMAKRNSDRLLSLVNQLLELSKIDAGQLKLRISKGDISGFISTLVEPFVYQAKQKQIEFTSTIDESDSEAFFDKDAVEKIIVNLLSNAVKYTPNEGEIDCKVAIKNNQLQFSIKNSGVGLTKSQRDNIFERFYQTSEDHTGSGVGLALVKELIDLYNGTIAVNSVPEQWTQFKVTLPIDKASFKNHQFVEGNDEKTNISPTYNQADIEETEFAANNNQPILLIVEDNKDVQILLKQNFEEHYSILLADNGQIGFDLALEHIPDVIISDIMMPVMDGVELTKTLKTDERTSHIPVVLLTAKAGDENELLGIETGADDYITKPFNSKLLTTKVSNLLELRQKLQERYSQELVLLPKDISVNSADEQFLNKVQAVLDEQLVESSFSIEDFSKAVGMSRMQLHRKLKAKTGLSAGAFIRSQRLKLAAELLKKSDCNISEVGYAVGFNDPSYFAKRFKEMYNCTPTEFAKKHS